MGNRLWARRRSRSAATPLGTPHPLPWAFGVAAASATFVLAAVTHLDDPYPADRLQGWPEVAQRVYELWLNTSGAERAVAFLMLLLVTLYTLRRYRQAELVRAPGPIEVADFVNATGDESLELAELSTEFRNSLGMVDLNSPAAVPGAGRPSEFLELLKAAGRDRSPVGSIAGLLGLTWVTHAYRVTAVLRQRPGDEPCGVTISVATLPRGGAEPDTVWAPDWHSAVHQAAIAVGAAVLPLTRLCKRPPWHDWYGLAMPRQLFADYLEAKALAAQHRYDEALGKYLEAVQRDPLNLYLRLEVGALQEQLQLYLDALATYDDIIALGTRSDERLRDALWDVGAYLATFARKGPAAARQQWMDHAERPLGEGWRGPRARRGIRHAAWSLRSTDRLSALLLARYRYALVLGFSEVVVAQWLRVVEGPRVTRRDRERDRLRSRLLPRLSRYPDPTPLTGPPRDADRAEHVLSTITPWDEHSQEHVQRLLRVEVDLRRAIQLVRRKAGQAPDCEESHADFAPRVRAGYVLREDARPLSGEAMHRTANALISAISLCPDKSWNQERAALTELLDRLPRSRRAGRHDGPTPVQILTAQECLQRAALDEIGQLIRDYRWWRGRRRPGMAVSATSVKVSRVWAQCRLARVEWLLAQERPSAAAAQVVDWPPEIGPMRLALDRALRGRLLHGHEWQDHYNAACTYAVTLLPEKSWAGASTGQMLAVKRRTTEEQQERDLRSSGYAAASVRALERAIDSSDSNFAAGRRSWLVSEDPDLVGFRERGEYARFRARNFPAGRRAVILPANVHVLQLSAYVTELLRALADLSHRHWTARLEDVAVWREQDVVVRWLEADVEAWKMAVELSREYRDWSTRFKALAFIKELGRCSGTVAPTVTYPTYPDPRIGSLDDVSNPESGRCLSIAGTFARQERGPQIEQLADIAEAELAVSMDVAVLERTANHELRALLGARAAAWLLYGRCLEVKFFTDDKERLRQRKTVAHGRAQGFRRMAEQAQLSPAPEPRERDPGELRSDATHR